MKKSKMTPEQWEKIRRRYESGETLSALASEVGCAVSSLHERKTREGWDFGRIEYREKMASQVETQIIKKVSETENRKPKKPKAKKEEPETEIRNENSEGELEIENEPADKNEIALLTRKAAEIKMNALELLESSVMKAKDILERAKKVRGHEVLALARVASESISSVDKVLGIHSEKDRLDEVFEAFRDIR